MNLGHKYKRSEREAATKISSQRQKETEVKEKLKDGKRSSDKKKAATKAKKRQKMGKS